MRSTGAYVLAYLQLKEYLGMEGEIKLGWRFSTRCRLHTAKDMDSRKLKEEFGRDSVFWEKEMETRGILLYGVEEETRSPVRERIDILERGGGLLFNRCMIFYLMFSLLM